MPDLTGQLLAVAGVLGAALITALFAMRRERKKEPIEERDAAYANAKVLSDASADWVTAVRNDLSRMQTDLDALRAQNSTLRADLETLRTENALLRSENADLTADLTAVYHWIESGAQPPPPNRRHRP